MSICLFLYLWVTEIVWMCGIMVLVPVCGNFIPCYLFQFWFVVFVFVCVCVSGCVKEMKINWFSECLIQFIIVFIRLIFIGFGEMAWGYAFWGGEGGRRNSVGVNNYVYNKSVSIRVFLRLCKNLEYLKMSKNQPKKDEIFGLSSS